MTRLLILLIVLTASGSLFAQGSTAPAPVRPDKYLFSNMKSANILGITAGTPGIINANLGYNFGAFDISASVSIIDLIALVLVNANDEDDEEEEDDSHYDYDPNIFLQVSSTVKLYRKYAASLSAGLAGGIMGYRDNEGYNDSFNFLYAGPCVHLCYKSYFAEFGIAYGKDFAASEDSDKKDIFPGMKIGETALIPLVQIGYFMYF